MSIAAVATKLAVVGGPKVHLAVAKVNKFSPQILTAVGIVGGVGATFLIARSTLHLEGVVNDHEARLEAIRVKTDEGMYESDKERSKEITRLYARSALNVGKLYGPGVSLGVASIVSVAAGQGIQQKRQVALVAGLKSAESALQAYRARVVEAIGEEKESEIRYGITTDTVEDENGKKTKVKNYNNLVTSDYILKFDDCNKNWQRGNRELNFMYLKNMQNWANERLNARGHVYLNEVLAWLGFPEVPSGQVVGWLHKDFNNGDGYIDFGWDNLANTQRRAFLDGEEDYLILDLNVDGEINSKL